MRDRRFDITAPGAIGHAGRGIVLAYVGLLVVLPLAAIVVRAIDGGFGAFVAAITADEAKDALLLSFGTSFVTALIQSVLGTATAFLLVRTQFRGKKFLSALVDLPLAMPTLIAGVMLVLLFGPGSPLGRFLSSHGVEVVYTRTAIVLALLFVTFPFVVRAVEPVLLELDPAEEEAAKTLGAGPFLTFRSVIFPAIAGAALSGSIRSFARALAEFGSLVVVSGNVPHDTLTAPVQIFGSLESGRTDSAVAVSLVILAVAAVVVGSARFVERRLGDRHG